MMMFQIDYDNHIQFRLTLRKDRSAQMNIPITVILF